MARSPLRPSTKRPKPGRGPAKVWPTPSAWRPSDPMDGRFYDGLKAVPLTVQVRPEGADIVLSAPDWEARWPLAQIVAERVGGQVRLAPRAGAAQRLMLDARAWSELAPTGTPTDRRRRGTEHRLILALGAGAALIGAFIFLGLPALSGPLARRT